MERGTTKSLIKDEEVVQCFAKATLNRTSRESGSKRIGIKDPSHLTLYINSSEDCVLDQKVLQ